MHTMYIRVYREDVDFSGIVYHTNFIKYMEYGRVELLREHGVDITEFHNDGVVFAFTGIKCIFRNAARCNDIIRLETTFEDCTQYQAIFRSDLYNQDGLLLNRGIAKIVAVNRFTKKAVPLPESFLDVAYKLLKKDKKF